MEWAKNIAQIGGKVLSKAFVNQDIKVCWTPGIYRAMT